MFYDTWCLLALNQEVGYTMKDKMKNKEIKSNIHREKIIYECTYECVGEGYNRWYMTDTL